MMLIQRIRRGNRMRLAAALTAIAGSAIIGSASEAGATSRSEATPSEISVKLANGQTEILYPYKVEKELEKSVDLSQVQEQGGLLEVLRAQEAKEREPDSGGSRVQCGVSISGQRIRIIGAGELDVLECNSLVEAGALPPVNGAQRIGLIYDVSTPNQTGRMAVILVQGSKGWSLDIDTLDQFENGPEFRSIRALAKALAKRRR